MLFVQIFFLFAFIGPSSVYRFLRRFVASFFHAIYTFVCSRLHNSFSSFFFFFFQCFVLLSSLVVISYHRRIIFIEYKNKHRWFLLRVVHIHAFDWSFVYENILKFVFNHNSIAVKFKLAWRCQLGTISIVPFIDRQNNNNKKNVFLTRNLSLSLIDFCVFILSLCCCDSHYAAHCVHVYGWLININIWIFFRCWIFHKLDTQ